MRELPTYQSRAQARDEQTDRCPPGASAPSSRPFPRPRPPWPCGETPRGRERIGKTWRVKIVLVEERNVVDPSPSQGELSMENGWFDGHSLELPNVQSFFLESEKMEIFTKGSKM